jgi:hypothetical protein
MDATVVEWSPDGRVRLELEGWIAPTLQERRAIVWAAERERDAIDELVEVLAGVDEKGPIS